MATATRLGELCSSSRVGFVASAHARYRIRITALIPSSSMNATLMPLRFSVTRPQECEGVGITSTVCSTSPKKARGGELRCDATRKFGRKSKPLIWTKTPCESFRKQQYFRAIGDFSDIFGTIDDPFAQDASEQSPLLKRAPLGQPSDSDVDLESITEEPVFQVRTLTSDGAELLIRPLRFDDLTPMATLLANTFADSTGMPSYRRFFQRRITEYLQLRLQTPSREAVCLVGLVAPPGSLDAGISGSSTDESAGPGDRRDYTYAGTVEVSFNPRTRAKFLTLNPPAQNPYLCNMAVDSAQRRRGIGRCLLKAAEQLTLQRSASGQAKMYLHCRVQDEPARVLYSIEGYDTMRTDLWGVQFLPGQHRRLLMRHDLK
mmetsp:Transcript_7134/g.12357  ORF Transcript_7134/g.12357 Transcript_7134/m.12357 type:complete len:375 (+) Transcript_7134:334-1458(+)